MAYRHLRSAVRARIETLEEEQRDVEARLADLETLLERKHAVALELDAAYAAFDRAGPPRTPPLLLPGVGPKSPCRQSWDAMDGDDRVRFCALCAQHVYNVSAMSAEEAAALVYETETRVCVRFLRRPDGTVITEECVGGRRKKRGRRVAAGFAVVAGYAAIQASVSRDPPPPPPAASPPPEARVMDVEYLGMIGPQPSPEPAAAPRSARDFARQSARRSGRGK